MPTQAEIQQFYQQNANNPDALRAAMAQHGVTADQASQATGQNASTFNNLALNNSNSFYGNNGQQYANQLGQGQTSFTASNGQTLTQQQIQDWYRQNGQRPGADQAMMTELGLKGPDLYKARQLAGQGAGTGIWTDPREYEQYGSYLRANPANVGNINGPMGFDRWRQQQDPGYLAGLQTGQGGGQMNTGGGSGGGQNLGMGGNSSASYGSGGGGQNPYLQGMGQNIVDQMTENYIRKELPASRSGAMAVGGFGGSRQGVIEANGLNDLNRGIGQNLTNLYGQDYTNQQNRNLQSRSIENQYDLGSRSLNNQYDLGLRSSDLGFANLDANIANSNFSNQLNAANFGLNATNSMNQQTGSAIQAGTDIQQAPQRYHQYFSNQANQAGGQGGTSTGTQTGASNPWVGAVGGGMAGYDLYRQYQSRQPQTGYPGSAAGSAF